MMLIDAATGATGPTSPAPTTLAVHQVAHGFSVGQAVYNNGTVWVLAESNAIGTLGIGLVIIVGGPDDFTVAFEGYATGLSGLTAGQYYFVSDATPGALTVTEPVSTTSFSNPLLFAITTTTGAILPFRPSTIGVIASPVIVATSVTVSAAVGQIILANTSGVGFTVNLPAASTCTGQSIIIKKVTGDMNVITIAPNGGDLIEGNATLLINLGFTSVTLVSDGSSNWYVI
jgi:hypothetical protein